MIFFNKLFTSKKFFLVNLSLVSILLGSLITSVIYVGCDQQGISAYAKSENKKVIGDKSALNAALNIQRAFRNVAQSVNPAVVSINAVVIKKAKRNPYRRYFDDDFFNNFFGNPYSRRRNNNRSMPQRKAKTLGTGFVINSKGYILTNYHVIKGASQIKVVFTDGTKYEAKVIGKDPETDIAVIKIKPKGKIPVAVLGDSSRIMVGDWAIAIGNAFGLPGTFTVGVVSAKSRGDKVGVPYQNFIQIDTAINPGNSGGPLVNISGQVIGINSMIYTKTGGSLGIGFAIPINVAKVIVESLIRTGTIIRGYIGIYPGKITDDMRKVLKIGKHHGVIINSIVKDGPADNADMEEGDVILSIDNHEITSVNQLMRVVALIKIGKKVKVVIQRKWKKKTVTLVISKRPSENLASNQVDTSSWMGLHVSKASSLSQRDLNRLGLDKNEPGVVVVKVDENSFQNKLRRGDLIKSINYDTIENISDYKKFIKRNKSTKSFLFKIIRQGRRQFVAVRK